MKKIAAAIVLAVSVLVALLLAGAGNGSSASGLRGSVLISPGYPVCQAGTSCSRPAADALLRFWRQGKVVAHTRTDGKGHFRIGLRGARTYNVTAGEGGTLRPTRVTVPAGRFRQVTLLIDIGIR